MHMKATIVLLTQSTLAASCVHDFFRTSPSLIYWPLHTHIPTISPCSCNKEQLLCAYLKEDFSLEGIKALCRPETALLLKNTPFAKIEGAYLSNETGEGEREKDCMYVCGGGKRERERERVREGGGDGGSERSEDWREREMIRQGWDPNSYWHMHNKVECHIRMEQKAVYTPCKQSSTDLSMQSSHSLSSVHPLAWELHVQKNS